MSSVESSWASELLQQMTVTAARLFGAAACSIALLDGEELVYAHATGEGADRIVGTRLPLTRGIAGWAISAGQPVAVSDVRSDPRWAQDVAEATGYVPRSIVAAPLQTDRDSYGVLTVLDATATGSIAENLLEVASLLAHQAALALEATGSAQGAEGGDARTELISLIRGLAEHEVGAVQDLVRTFVRYVGR